MQDLQSALGQESLCQYCSDELRRKTHAEELSPVSYRVAAALQLLLSVWGVRRAGFISPGRRDPAEEQRYQQQERAIHYGCLTLMVVWTIFGLWFFFNMNR